MPRRWLMPNPKISLKDFKSLLARRSKALSRLHASTTITNPNPDTDPIAAAQNGSLGVQSEEPAKVVTNNDGEGPSSKGEEEDRKELELAGGDGSLKKPVVDGSDSFVDSKNVVLEKAPEPGDGGSASMEKQTEPVSFPFCVIRDRGIDFYGFECDF